MSILIALLIGTVVAGATVGFLWRPNRIFGSTVIRRRAATAALLAAVAAAATDWGYVSLIHAQGATTPNPGVVPFVTVYIAAIAATALLGATLILSQRGIVAETVLFGASAGSWALGILAIFSIGMALLITAILLAIAAHEVAPKRRQPVRWVTLLLGPLIALGFLAAGFAIANA